MPSPTDERSEPRVAGAGRALGLALLMLVAAVALRGYLPGAPQTPREPSPDNPLAMVVVVGLLVAAVAVVAVAVAVRARHRTPAPAAEVIRPDWLRGEVGRPTWRAALITFGVVLAWLLIALLLSRIGGGEALDPPTLVPDDTPAPDPPTPDPASDDPASIDLPSAGPNLLGYFFAAAVVFLLVLVCGSVLAMRRSPRRPSGGPLADAHKESAPADDGSESLARAAEVGLAAVEDLSREPRKAIIVCYAAMERELSRVPGAAPQQFDTATEVLDRAVDLHALAPGTATDLVDLFDEARFSPHVMNEGHREVAAQVLQRVLAELQGQT